MPGLSRQISNVAGVLVLDWKKGGELRMDEGSAAKSEFVLACFRVYFSRDHELKDFVAICETLRIEVPVSYDQGLFLDVVHASPAILVAEFAAFDRSALETA
jgi:hypothetical protein